VASGRAPTSAISGRCPGFVTTAAFRGRALDRPRTLAKAIREREAEAPRQDYPGRQLRARCSAIYRTGGVALRESAPAPESETGPTRGAMLRPRHPARCECPRKCYRGLPASSMTDRAGLPLRRILFFASGIAIEPAAPIRGHRTSDRRRYREWGRSSRPFDAGAWWTQPGKDFVLCDWMAARSRRALSRGAAWPFHVSRRGRRPTRQVSMAVM
jgi:hypothetical protein